MTSPSIYSAVLGDVVLKRQYSAQDKQELGAAGAALEKNHFDVLTDEGIEKNQSLLYDFFDKHRELPVNTINIYRAINERKSDFVWLTPAQHAWYKHVIQDRTLALGVSDQIKNFRLVQDGEPGFINMSAVFLELQRQNQQATWTAVRDAIDRIQHQPGNRLTFTEAPTKEHYSEASKEFDGKNPFTNEGLTLQRDGSYGKSPADYAREAREAQQSQEQKEAARQQRNRVKDTSEIIVDTMLKDGTHSQQADSKLVYDRMVKEGRSFFDIRRELGVVKARHQRFKGQS